jgi:hypothetical protein
MLHRWDKNANQDTHIIANGSIPITTINGIVISFISLSLTLCELLIDYIYFEDTIAYIAYVPSSNNYTVLVAQYDLTANAILTRGDVWFNETTDKQVLAMGLVHSLSSSLLFFFFHSKFDLFFSIKLLFFISLLI